MAEAQQLGIWGPQEWGEPIEGPRDELAEFVENRECQIPVTAEDYIAGHLGIDLYVWRWTSRFDTDPSHYVAHCRSWRRVDDLALEMTHASTNLADEFAIDKDISGGVVKGNVGPIADEEGRLDFSVLVTVGESGQDGQERDRVLPSVVTLESLSFLGRLSANMLEVAMTPEPLGIEVGEDREHDVPRLVLGGFSPEMIYRQLPPKVVKGTAHVVNGIPDHEAPIVADLWDPLGDPKDEIVLRIKLPSRSENPGWGFSVARRENGPSEVFYMALCPRQLVPASF